MTETITRASDMAWRGILGGVHRNIRQGPQALIDIGSSKLCCYIAHPRIGSGFELAGRGYQAAAGFRAGNVIDIDEASRSIGAVLQEAEKAAGIELREIAVTWSGGAPRSHLVSVSRRLGGHELLADDADIMLQHAFREGESADRVVVDAIPVEMTLDDGRVLRDACGLAADSVSLMACVTTVDRSALDGLIACLEDCHIEPSALVSTGYAAGIACITQEEIDRGCLVIELGGGTTNVAHFHGGRLVYLNQIAYGGDNVSRDIAYGLNTGAGYAERLKTLYGSVQWRSCDDNMRIDVPLIGDHVDAPTGEIPRTRLTMIVRARVEEILNLVQEGLREAWGLFEERPPRSVVVTGGGGQVEGIVELVEEMFGLPARLGRPDLVQGRNGVEDQPCCSAASGALALISGDDEGLHWRPPSETPALAQGLAKINRWWKQNFTG
ncbi:MAG: cell division protein FtsA [Geminicoccaceae bacterium]|nr:cell division protein FtsA [Geminicoccaceae bacterium]MCB9943813.1 cell division protein FtsA [Geminicoccaceae bacterium]